MLSPPPDPTCPPPSPPHHQAEALCSRQQELRGVLDAQRAQLAARKKLEAEALQVEHQAEQVRAVTARGRMPVASATGGDRRRS